MAKPLTDQIKEAAASLPQQHLGVTDWSKTLSTGSTILDLAISGLKCRLGGLPGGMVMEISGPPGTGKTTIGAELTGSAQRQGGEIRIKDPESRLDADYCRKMGVNLPMVEHNGFLVPDPEIYSQPDTITDVIESIIGPLESKNNKMQRQHDKAWRPDPNFINCCLTDSLAALSTRMEMEQGDKMGQRRAKELSEGMRVSARHIAKHNILLVCTNQLRDNVDGGQFAPKKITPGGNAIPYYSSVRIQLTLIQTLRKDKDTDPHGKLVKAYVSKNSKDIEYRSAPIRLLFGYGIDDIGANLQWLKDHGAMRQHPTDPGKVATGFVVGDRYFPANMAGGALEAAIKFVEDEGFEQDVKEWVADVWNQIEEQRPKRKEKVR